jgi:hypothetical protein
MRTLRAAFVVTVAAACTRNTPPPEEPSHNPPALPAPDVAMIPHNPPAAVCPPRETLHEGDACTAAGLDCYLPTGGCQPSGFQCREGRWREVTVTCNPPSPPGEP